MPSRIVYLNSDEYIGTYILTFEEHEMLMVKGMALEQLSQSWKSLTEILQNSYGNFGWILRINPL